MRSIFCPGKSMLFLFVAVLAALIMAAPVMAQKEELAAGQESQDPNPKPLPSMDEGNPSKAAKLFDAIEVETFSKLNKLGVAPYMPAPASTTTTADYKVALNLGIAVADALSAAVNKDKDAFLKLAGQVHGYGETLGVEDAVLAKYTAITKATDKGDWKELENLIYGLKDDITEQLYREDMKDAAILAMVSGWLEGMYVVSKSLEQNFNEKAAGLLEDRTFASFLNKSMADLGADVQGKAEVKAIKDALPKIDDVINRPLDYKFQKDDAAKVAAILEPLRQIIVK
jgi:hypothetical protein